MENTPLLNKIVTIKECGMAKTSTGKDMVNIKADGMYHIPFVTTKGEETKAYQTIKNVIPQMLGKEVGIGYAESKYEVGGEQRIWRTIRVLDLTPDPNKYSEAPSSPAPASDRLNLLENRIGKLENEVRLLKGGQQPLEANSEPVIDLSEPLPPEQGDVGLPF